MEGRESTKKGRKVRIYINLNVCTDIYSGISAGLFVPLIPRRLSSGPAAGFIHLPGFPSSSFQLIYRHTSTLVQDQLHHLNGERLSHDTKTQTSVLMHPGATQRRCQHHGDKREKQRWMLALTPKVDLESQVNIIIISICSYNVSKHLLEVIHDC